MGYDASVYIIYGVPFPYGNDEDLQWLVNLMVPDIVEKYGEENAWHRFDLNPHTNGYYLIDFGAHRILFVSCWWTEHSVTKTHGSHLLTLPSKITKKRFLDWCANNNVDTESVGFYTVLTE